MLKLPKPCVNLLSFVFASCREFILHETRYGIRVVMLRLKRGKRKIIVCEHGYSWYSDCCPACKSCLRIIQKFDKDVRAARLDVNVEHSHGPVTYVDRRKLKRVAKVIL